MSKKREQCDQQSEESNYTLCGDGDSLTVFGDPERLGLVFADAKQHNGGVEGCSDLCLLQQVINQLDLLPAGTQQHCDGLHTKIDVSKTQHGLPHGSPV